MKEEVYEENLWTDYAFLSIQETRWCQQRETGEHFQSLPSERQLMLTWERSNPSEWVWMSCWQILWMEGYKRFHLDSNFVSDMSPKNGGRLMRQSSNNRHTVIYKKFDLGFIWWEIFELRFWYPDKSEHRWETLDSECQ